MLTVGYRLMRGATNLGSQESNLLPKMTLFLLKVQCNREFFKVKLFERLLGTCKYKNMT